MWCAGDAGTQGAQVEVTVWDVRYVLECSLHTTLGDTHISKQVVHARGSSARFIIVMVFAAYGPDDGMRGGGHGHHFLGDSSDRGGRGHAAGKPHLDGASRESFTRLTIPQPTR